MPERKLISHDYSPYGNSTFFFFAPSITSTEGRSGAGAGVAGFTAAAVSPVAWGRGRLGAVVRGAGFASLPTPDSGSGNARSPESSDFLVAPLVTSSP